MIYTFACDGCSQTVEVTRPMDQAGEPAHCEICTAPMRRVFDSHSICDEIRSVTYVDPKTSKTVKGHGRYFDIGARAWINSKSGRRRMMKDKNLLEVGPRMV